MRAPASGAPPELSTVASSHHPTESVESTSAETFDGVSVMPTIVFDDGWAGVPSDRICVPHPLRRTSDTTFPDELVKRRQVAPLVIDPPMTELSAGMRFGLAS